MIGVKTVLPGRPVRWHPVRPGLQPWQLWYRIFYLQLQSASQISQYIGHPPQWWVPRVPSEKVQCYEYLSQMAGRVGVLCSDTSNLRSDVSQGRTLHWTPPLLLWPRVTLCSHTISMEVIEVSNVWWWWMVPVSWSVHNIPVSSLSSPQ